MRVLGNSADINGQSVITRMSQVYSDQQKHVVVEVEIPADLAHATVDSNGSEITNLSKLATVSITYMNMVSELNETLTGDVSVSFSSSDEKVKASVNNAVMADVVALVLIDPPVRTSVITTRDQGIKKPGEQQKSDFLSTRTFW